MAYRWTRAWLRGGGGFYLIKSCGLNATQCPPLPLSNHVSQSHTLIRQCCCHQILISVRKKSFCGIRPHKYPAHKPFKGTFTGLVTWKKDGWIQSSRSADISSHSLSDARRVQSLSTPINFWTPVENKRMSESIQPQDRSVTSMHLSVGLVYAHMQTFLD